MDDNRASTKSQTRAPTLAELRRELHQIPELDKDLPQNQMRAPRALQGLPLESSKDEQVTSATATPRGGKPGPIVLPRGDVNDLPAAAAHDCTTPSTRALKRNMLPARSSTTESSLIGQLPSPAGFHPPASKTRVTTHHR